MNIGAVEKPEHSRPQEQDYRFGKAQDQLKMNCDAAIGTEHSYVVVVARDWREKLVFACSKKVNTKVPEAKAFLWAVQLASQMQFKNVIIEGDSNYCVEAVTNNSSSVHWRIADFVNKVGLLSASFDWLEFMWVYRNANKLSYSCLGKVVSFKLLFLAISLTGWVLLLFLILLVARKNNNIRLLPYGYLNNSF